MDFQRVPGRINIARPKECSVTLHAGLPITMQGEWPLVRTKLLRAFPVHAMAREPRWSIEAVTLIRPPAVDAHIVELFVNRPVTTYLSIIRPASVRCATARQWRSRAWIIHRARQTAPFEHGVQHHFEMLRVQLVYHLLRIGKVRLIPRELPVVRVPSGGSEVRPEIDDAVAGQFLFAEGARHPHNFLGSA